MDNKYWSVYGSSAGGDDINTSQGHHITDSTTSPGLFLTSPNSNGEIYLGKLTMGMTNYKAGEEPYNPSDDTTISNIFMAKTSATGPTNYTMSFTA